MASQIILRIIMRENENGCAVPDKNNDKRGDYTTIT